jgi:hypothetical protein
MKTESQDAATLFPESWLEAQRGIVQRGIAAGWIIPPAPAPKIESRVAKRKKKSRHG